MPVIKHYEALGKVAEVSDIASLSDLSHGALQIDSTAPVDEVHRNAKGAVLQILNK
jgi:hypothetical protein